MALPALVTRARELWEHLAGTSARFTPVISVAVPPRSRLCPPGWTGIAVICDAAIVRPLDPDDPPSGGSCRRPAPGRVARTLGFRELGSHASLRVAVRPASP